MSHIALLDPALKNHQGDLPTNLGDIIIYDSVKRVLGELFPKFDIVRISSHVPLKREHFRIIKQAEFTFIGGTNILTSDIVNGYRQLPIKREDNKWMWLFPGLNNIILFGVGWGSGYKLPISQRTKIYYKRMLSKNYIHSLRDSYSANKMKKLVKIVNTSCPTLWGLAKTKVNRVGTEDNCLFTLTDYRNDKQKDSLLIETCMANFSKLTFFPQGEQDLEYLNSLEIYNKNKDKFNILPHCINTYYEFAQNESYTYVGTRLHGGIHCLQVGRDAVIMSVDNRATEMASDTGLPVIKREELKTLQEWLNGKPIFENIELPIDNIEIWKNQFQ